jgi:histidyl-tRNA synthetase
LHHRNAKGIPSAPVSGHIRRFMESFVRLAALHGYADACTPVLEHTELFLRPIDERGGLSLRRSEPPPASEQSCACAAPILRLRRSGREVQRCHYLAPVSMAEPGGGWSRRFHQAGCEVFGDPGPLSDAELVDLLAAVCDELRLTDVELRLNSVGDRATRDRYRALLLEHLRPRIALLSERSRTRLEADPLRVLSSSDPADRDALSDAPNIHDVLDAEDRRHFDSVCYRVDPWLVSGLDYHTRTIFELALRRPRGVSSGVLARGGRYDTMNRTSGGFTPAAGFALCVEAFAQAMDAPHPVALPVCRVLPSRPGRAEAVNGCYALARELRLLGVRAQIDLRDTPLESRVTDAECGGARICLIVAGGARPCRIVLIDHARQRHERRVAPRAAAAEVVQALRPGREAYESYDPFDALRAPEATPDAPPVVLDEVVADLPLELGTVPAAAGALASGSAV